MVGGGLNYIFLIIFFLLPVSLHAQEPEGVVPDNMMMDTSATVFEYRRLGITIVAPSKGIELLYLPNIASRVREIAEQSQYAYLLGASSDTVGANYRTGWLKIGGVQYRPFVANNSLTHIIRFDPRSRRAMFIPRSTFVTDTSAAVTEFQAGPLVLENGKPVVTPLPAVDKHLQTLLIIAGDNEIFLLVTRARYSLSDLAERLLNLSIFKGKRLDAIALGVGDSTLLYSRNFYRVNLNAGEKMPLLIGIR